MQPPLSASKPSRPPEAISGHLRYEPRDADTPPWRMSPRPPRPAPRSHPPWPPAVLTPGSLLPRRAGSRVPPRPPGRSAEGASTPTAGVPDTEAPNSAPAGARRCWPGAALPPGAGRGRQRDRKSRLRLWAQASCCSKPLRLGWGAEARAAPLSSLSLSHSF